MARRQSIMQNDLMGLPSPHPGDDRRKSLFPILPNHRRSSVAGGVAGFLAAKRFKKTTLKTECSPNQIQVNYEPTYRMDPKVKFTVVTVHKMLKEILDERLDGFKYNPKFCVTMTQVLTDEIKDRIKQMSWDRYKLVVLVILGERKDQDVMVTSRCAWDPKVDSYASYTFTNKTLFCTASAFGIYTE
ncbi:dynein light chain Tctex-type 5-like [Haliotis rufescens]|uniref:dynein light chain Tctex-type 5-like n=1 Tax=Haliotis rufescens TaxID=6454 RepID=UPI001EAFBEF4|nr:dynein light chain Tctex-type 5-like [Haliotis rufescens]